MVLKKIAPPKSLAHIIEYYWVLKPESGTTDRNSFRIVSDTNPGIVFSLAKKPFKTVCPYNKEEYPVPELFLYGSTDKHIDVSVDGDFLLLGIRFTPWAFYYLDGIPNCRVVNQTVPLSEIFDRTGNGLKIKLTDEIDLQKRIKQINDFIEYILNNKPRDHSLLPPQLGEIFRGNGDLSVKEITRKSMLSRRQMERNFREITGLSPKKFLRIARFQQALKKITEQQSLSDIAYTTGYCDQAHFSKEFKLHCGITPKEYFHKRKFSFIVDSFLRIDEP